MSSKTAKSYSKRARTFVDAPEPTVKSPSATRKRTRDVSDDESELTDDHHVSKRPKRFNQGAKSIEKAISKDHDQTRKPLRQLVLSFSTRPAFTSCVACGLSYTRGAPEDELLHKAHCDRIRKGGEWTKEDEKEAGNMGMIVVEPQVLLSSGQSGRIVCVRASAGGKVGTKLSAIMSTINTALSAPSLSKTAIEASKLYLFLVSVPKCLTKERIAGCIIVQNIKSGLRVMAPDIIESDSIQVVDQGVFCDPTPRPCIMGVSRIFVSCNYRRTGVATALLDAAARTFIHGCSLNSQKGQVAFSQPTSDGQRLMKRWGSGEVLIFEE